jgi:hypothetical protein
MFVQLSMIVKVRAPASVGGGTCPPAAQGP